MGHYFFLFFLSYFIVPFVMLFYGHRKYAAADAR